MKRNKLHIWKIILFVSILCLATFLRLYKLDQIPPGVNRDEASIGYTAYSLIETGKDEYGKPFPFSFQSFGDWKLPLYIYATIPFVKIFGVTELAVRLPSAIAGIATVGLTFFLVEYLFSSTSLSFLSMALLAVSPWHLHLSRVESESNLAVLFTVIGLLFFFRGIKKQPIFLIGSSLFFALCYFAYHGNHVTTTLLLIGLIYIFRLSLPKTIHTAIAGIIFVTLVGFILFQTLHQADKTKLSGISIFGNPAIIHEKIEIPRNQYSNPKSWNARLFHNRITYALETITQNYLKSFAPKFLFITGGTNHAHNIENFGNLYFIEAPFFYLGIVLLIFKKKDRKVQLLLWWLIIAPIAASITKDAPHTNRMFAIYPLPPILIALAIQKTLQAISSKKNLWNIAIVSIAIAYIFNISIYFDRYFIHFPQNEAQYWGYGYKQLAQVLQNPKTANKHIIISHPEYSPYIFLLFYMHYDPLSYQQKTNRYPPTDDAFVHVKNFDRFEFRSIDWTKDMLLPNTILIDFSEDIPHDILLDKQNIKNITLPNSKFLLTIVET